MFIVIAINKKKNNLWKRQRRSFIPYNHDEYIKYKSVKLINDEIVGLDPEG